VLHDFAFLLVDQLISLLVLLFEKGLGQCLVEFVVQLGVTCSFLFCPAHSLSAKDISLFPALLAIIPSLIVGSLNGIFR
jgi:hypothetical protein